MKIRCDKSELQNACLTAARAAASKSSVPALEGLKLEAAAGEIKVYGYDLRKGIVSKIFSDTDESGTIIVNARLFCEILRKMPDGNVSITTGDNWSMVIKCGMTRYNLTGSDPEEYPEFPAVEETESITVSQKILKNMISQTIYAISTNDVRPIYTGTLFDIDSENLTLVSIDGFRLAKRTEPHGQSVENETSFVVPGYSLSDVEKICLDDEEKTVGISVSKKHIIFKFEDTTVITRRLEGDFLNYKKSIPETFANTITVVRTELISTIDRVALIITEKNTNPIRITFSNGTINCKCNTPISKSEDTCSCEGNGNDLEIGFNDKYFMDALKNADTEKISINLNTPTSPCIIEAADGSKKFTYMILPVRLKAGE